MGTRVAGSTRVRTWTTSGLPESDQFAFWQTVADEAFCPVVVHRGDEGPFKGAVTARRVGAIAVSCITSEAQSVTRTPTGADVRVGDAFFLNLPLSAGTLARQGDRTAHLAAGDFAIVDSTRPFELGFDRSFAQISLAVPHDLIARRVVCPAAVTAVRVAGDRGVGAFASTMLRRLAIDSRPVDRAAARSLDERLVDLIALALAPGGVQSSTRHRTRGVLLQAALDEVDRSLAIPDLTPTEVAARIYISSRYLHRLFSEHGISFGRWVAERRLQRCHHALSDPRHAHQNISTIAAEHGFLDPSYFSRAFKARYDVTPRQVRRAAASRAEPAAGRAQHPPDWPGRADQPSARDAARPRHAG